jgi:hypothetical protein
VVHPAVGPDEVEAARAAVFAALDGRIMTREELAAEVGHPRLSAGFAFLLDELCQGPPRGSRVTLARPDQWIEGWQPVDEQVALREVCRRFVSIYGPTRPSEFAEWVRAKLAVVRPLFESLDLDEVDVEGRRAFVLAGDADYPEAEPSVRLLPEYDVYVMGFREREHLVPEAVRAQVAAHGRGRYEGPAGVRFLLVDGVAAGLWERKKTAKRIELRVTPVRKLTRAELSALEAEGERIAAFFGVEPVLTVE